MSQARSTLHNWLAILHPAAPPDLSNAQSSRFSFDEAGAEYLSRRIFLLWAAIIFGIILLVAVPILIFRSPPPYTIEFMPSMALASLVVLLGMAVLYWYAYSFYQDRFYALAALGWAGNAIYFLGEGFFKPQPHDSIWAACIYILGKIYMVAFQAAALVTPDQFFNRRKFCSGLLLWWSFILGSLYLDHRYLHISWENGSSWVIILPGVLYALWTLIYTGKSLTERLRTSDHGRWRDILPLTFYCYAGLGSREVRNRSFPASTRRAIDDCHILRTRNCRGTARSALG